MRINYDEHDWQFLARILDESSGRLSRTRAGVSDTTASESKRPLLLSGDELRRQSAANEAAVIQWIMRVRKQAAPAEPAEVRSRLLTIAELTNRGLLPAGPLRTWDVPYRKDPLGDDGYEPSPSRQIPATELDGAIDAFCRTVQARWSELQVDPVPLAAWSEWHLNPGPLHPFYDGCGRAARLFAAMLLVHANCLPPLFDDRPHYFEAANAGPLRFAEYFRERIDACAEWLRGQTPAGNSYW